MIVSRGYTYYYYAGLYLEILILHKITMLLLLLKEFA